MVGDRFQMMAAAPWASSRRASMVPIFPNPTSPVRS